MVKKNYFPALTDIEDIPDKEIIATRFTYQFFRVMKNDKKNRHVIIKDMFSDKMMTMNYGTTDFVVISKLTDKWKDLYRDKYKEQKELFNNTLNK